MCIFKSWRGAKTLMYSQLKWKPNKHKHTQFTFSFPPESDWSFARPLCYILVPLSSATHLREGRAKSFPTPKPQSCLMNFTHQDGCLRAVWHQGDWLNPRLVHSCSFYLFVFFPFGLCKMCLWCMFSTFLVWRDGLKTVSSFKLESFLKRTLEAIMEALSLDSSWRDV